MYPERPITPAEACDIDISGPGNLLKQTGFPFEDRRRPGQSGTRQPHGEHGIASRFGNRDPFPLRQVARAG